jgi:hypothetical protein
MQRSDTITLGILAHFSHFRHFYALYVVDEVLPPLPVQLVWKNSPLGLSTRS